MDANIPVVAGAVILFVAVLLFGQFAYWAWVNRREQEARELSRRLGTVVDKTAAPLFDLRRRVEEGTGLNAYLEKQLRSAGSPYDPGTLYLRMLIAGIVGVLLALALFRSPAAVVGIAAAWIPVMILSSQAETRARKLNEQLPDGLDLIARSLQAGHGVSEAMRTAAEELPMPLAQEFGRVYEENNLGRDFRECMDNLTKRNPNSFDLQIFASSVLLQRDTGGNLVEILNNISATIRSRFVFQGKLRALTSEARFTAYILGGLPFAILGILMALTPDYLTPLFTDPLGHALLAGASLSFSVGVFTMRELSKVEV